jgi:hypothetical protein
MYAVENNIYFELQFDEPTQGIVWSDLIETSIERLKKDRKINIEYNKVTERPYNNLNIITIPQEKSIILSDHERIIYIGNEVIFKKLFGMKYDFDKNQIDFYLYKQNRTFEISFNPSLLINEHYKCYCVKGPIATNIKHTHNIGSKYDIFTWISDEEVIFTEDLLEDIDSNRSSSDMARWFEDGSLLFKNKQGSIWVISGGIVIYIGYFSDITDLPCVKPSSSTKYTYAPDEVPLVCPDKESIEIEDYIYYLEY